MNQITLNAMIAGELVQRFENDNTIQYESSEFYIYLMEEN